MDWRAADIDAPPPRIRPSRLASCMTCVSSGMTSVRLSTKPDHSPRSTGEPLLTIHLKNMHTRLHAESGDFGTTAHAPRSRNAAHIAETAAPASPPQRASTSPPSVPYSRMIDLYASKNARIAAWWKKTARS